ncbi:MAG: hypothetical protein AABY09_01260, partial [Nanoarchaeota archaeon]
HHGHEAIEAEDGQDGLGKPGLGAPAIAGHEAWYIEEQLRKFRSGARGWHAEDLEGLRMKPMALRNRLATPG